MDTVHTHAPDIMTQATDLLGMFLEMFSTDGIGRDDTGDLITQGLAQYTSQVEHITTAAKTCADLGLYHVCAHYRPILEALSGCNALSEDVRLALEEWPTLVMGYLETPTDPDICLMLVEHLQNPAWATPLPAAEAEALHHLLLPMAVNTPAVAAVAESQPAAVDSDDIAARTQADLALVLEPLAPEVAPEMAPPDLQKTIETPTRHTTSEDTDFLSALVLDTTDTVSELPTYTPDFSAWTASDKSTPLHAATPEVSDEEAPLPMTEEEVLNSDAIRDDIVPDAIATMPDPIYAGLTAASASPADASRLDDESASEEDTPGMDTLDDLLTEEPWEEESTIEVDTADASIPDTTFALPEHAISPEQIEEFYGNDQAMVLTPSDDDFVEEDSTSTLTMADAEAYANEASDTFDDDIDTAESSSFDATAQSLITLLCQEITQLAAFLDTALRVTATEEWRQALTDHVEDLERLGDGAASLGLQGVQHVSAHLGANLLQIITQEQPLSPVQQQMITAWPALLLDYLQRLHAPAPRLALVHYLQDGRWPEPLSVADGTMLHEALVVTTLTIEDAEPAPERQIEAQLADLSLTLPEDVNAELLGTLLQELPRQAADFSAAIQRLTAGTGTLADVDVAQRIAHSLKGAANTVGVPGVANLTHHLEDILLAFAQQGALPTRALSRTLTSAADCLEAMSETLSGMGAPAPQEDTLRVFQEVLDWANLVDTAGVPSDDTTCPPVRDTLPGLLAESIPSAATPAGTTAAGPGTRLATDMVDDMLRLTGESMILTGQLQNRLSRTMVQTRAIRTQNTVLQQLLWDLEQLVDIHGVTSPLLQRAAEGEFDPLEMEQYNELHTVSRRLLEAVVDALTLGQDVEGSLVTLDGLLHEQRRVQRESEETVMRTRMVPVHTIVPRLQRGVRQACRLTGKEVTLILHGADTLIDSAVLNGLLDPLMHILRNAVDHGMEASEQREASGKPGTGTITLTFGREGNTIVMRCRDDGAGLDYAAIRRTARERGLMTTEDSLSEEELGRLILRAGFSTRAQTTQISGRGIGMDVVATRVQELKGTMSLSSTARQGCQVELRLPVSLMSTHGVLVRSGKQVFAVSNLGVEQILYTETGALRQEDGTLTYRLGEESFATTTLEALLHLADGQNPIPLRQRPALLVRDATGRRRVVLVQALLDSLTLVVKPLGRYIPSIKGIVGATILGDGSVTPVLDLPELLGSSTQRHLDATDAQEPMAAERALPVALVVDDSLSARRALADFVRDLGFEVHTAGDGLEAVASMARKVPDVLLADLEMPRMNGLELAAHVRAHADTAHVPIIMITSRSTEKHRRTAAQSGVDVYLVKPFPEDELAEHIHQLTTQRQAA